MYSRDAKEQRLFIESLEEEEKDLRGKISRGYAAMSKFVLLYKLDEKATGMLFKQIQSMENYWYSLTRRIDYYRNSYLSGNYCEGVLADFGVTER